MTETTTPSSTTESGSPTIRVTFQDVLEGRAYLRIPFVGKLLLCHWAGAPWSDKKPDAHLHALQVETIAHREREQIVHGASRLGKSVLGGCKLTIAQMLPRRKIAIGAKRYDHVAHEFQYLYRAMKTIFARHPEAIVRLIFKHQQNYHDYDCETIWGSRTVGLSIEADEGASFLGREFTDVILGEGSHIPPEILYKKILRALDGATMAKAHGAEEEDIAQLTIFTTPKGYEGASAAEWERVQRLTNRQPWKLEYGSVPYVETVWVREASILENPAYSRKVFEARKNTLDKNAFEEQYLGKMTFATGRVYKEFDEERHIVKMPPPADIRDMRLAIGIDTGAFKGVVLKGIDKQRRKFALGEVYGQKTTIFDTLADLKTMVVDVLSPVFGTDDFDLLKQRVELWVVDPASQHKLEIAEALDVSPSAPMQADKLYLLPSIERVRLWMEGGQYYVVDDCVYLIDQIKKYTWRQMKSINAKEPVVKEPRKDYDHLLDADRYAGVALDDLGPLEEPPEPITMKEAWEKAQRDRIVGPLRAALEEGRMQQERMGWRF